MNHVKKGHMKINEPCKKKCAKCEKPYAKIKTHIICGKTFEKSCVKINYETKCDVKCLKITCRLHI